MNWKLIKEKNTEIECTYSRTQNHFSSPAVFTGKPALEYEVRKYCIGHTLPQINAPDKSLSKFSGFLTFYNGHNIIRFDTLQGRD